MAVLLGLCDCAQRAEFLHIPTSPENLPSTPLQLLQRDGTLQKKPAQQSQRAFPPEG